MKTYKHNKYPIEILVFDDNSISISEINARAFCLVKDDNGNYTSSHISSKDWIEIKKVLLTTEDGVEITHKSTTVFWVDSEKLISGSINVCYIPTHDYAKIFSTKEAAEKYIAENKPVLSIKDIKDAFNNYDFDSRILVNSQIRDNLIWNINNKLK